MVIVMGFVSVRVSIHFDIVEEKSVHSAPLTEKTWCFLPTFLGHVHLHGDPFFRRSYDGNVVCKPARTCVDYLQSVCKASFDVDFETEKIPVRCKQ